MVVILRELTIYRRYFTQSDCFKAATRQRSVGVQVHSTGANNPWLRRYVGPDDGRLGKNTYNNHSNRPGTDVCASAYIGKLADGSVAVYQTLPWDYRCWLSGKGTNGNANRMGYVGFEICEDGKTDANYFRDAVMTASVNLTAYLCGLFVTTPRAVVKTFAQGAALAVMDHSELHSRQLASNHGDIRHWLRNFGLTMEDYRNAVEAAMRDGVHVTYVDCDAGSVTTDTSKPIIDKDGDAMYQATVTSPGAYLNLRANKSTSSSSLAKMYSGAVVDVLDDSDSAWWCVRYNGVTGYAMTNAGSQDIYLTPVKSQEDKNEEEPDSTEEATRVDAVPVSRKELEELYLWVGKLLGA